MSAWLELLGSPYHHVSRFQKMAAPSAQIEHALRDEVLLDETGRNGLRDREPEE